MKKFFVVIGYILGYIWACISNINETNTWVLLGVNIRYLRDTYLGTFRYINLILFCICFGIYCGTFSFCYCRQSSGVCSMSKSAVKKRQSGVVTKSGQLCLIRTKSPKSPKIPNKQPAILRFCDFSLDWALGK